ncbi:ABC transporter ATP-binding protein [Chitinophaga sp. GCM10012297]|uniref:ABC transporter ATP-binding protein n=1 Tax=Chitinophaga chungangae TaxID=2821488 RepID=A0ABS3YGG6_9BACT|nr:ABC transporter ATP-binding protein [Chitinophaga chungangae]MBO9153782.1 ABC transporter ATP-binding protein [Chitinophaga chungangae]
MKTYFRLLSFAKPIEKYAIPYILFTLISVVFGTLNLALVAPLLTTLFGINQDPNCPAPPPVKPDSFFDVFKTMNYYAAEFNRTIGLQQTLLWVCAVIITSVLISNIFRYLSEKTMENLRIHTLLNLRKSVFNNVMNLDLSYFNNERKGDIISKVSSDVQTVQFSVTGTLQVIFKEPLTLITYLVMLFMISYKLTLFSMLVIPVAGWLISRIVKRLKQQAAESHETYGNMISYLDEALSGIRIIKAFNASNYIKDRFDNENKTYSRIIRAMAKRIQLASPVSEFMGVLMVAGIVYYGGTLIAEGSKELNPAEFIAYIAIFSQIMRPAKAISQSFSNIHSGIAAGERVLNLIDTKPSIVNSPDARPISDFKDRIEFRGVTFGYGERTILDHVDFSIPKGKSVALVGPSGGGKSTLMDLIPRFIEPWSGEIRIDGRNINEYTMESVRDLMGIVNQDTILFNDTIFNNIAFGNQAATQEEVEAAARIANAHEFILGTEKGYQTRIGDRGVKLSGGQRQRICIARAVLRNPPIMLLDEATSALDTESEKMVQDALNNLMKNRTSVIIAHRLSTIQTADLIIVVEQGKIVETGTHIELLGRNGLYKKLIEMQTFSGN